MENQEKQLVDLSVKVRKHDVVAIKNQLFNCKYTLSLWEEKLLKGILFLNQEEGRISYDSLISIDKFKLKELMFGAEARQSDHYMENVLRHVLSRVVKLKANSGDYILTHWVQRIKYNKKNEKIEVQFDNDIVPILKKHGNFTLAQTRVVFGAKCVYTERLYPLLIERKNLGVKKRIITIEEIITNWELPKSYNVTGNLISKVINPAVAEINRLSDIRVIYRPIKDHYKIVSFEFHIEDKEPAKETIDTTAKKAVKSSIWKAIKEYAPELDSVELGKWQQPEETTEEFEAKLMIALEHCKNHKNTRDPAALYWACIRDIYRNEGVMQNIFTAHQAEEEIRAEKEERERQEQEKAALKAAWELKVKEFCKSCQQKDKLQDYQSCTCDGMIEDFNGGYKKVVCPLLPTELGGELE